MEGEFKLLGTIGRPPWQGGGLQVYSRDCGDHFEVAPVGFFQLKDGSLMYQWIIADKDIIGRTERRVTLTWRRLQLGPISLSPIIFNTPKDISSTSLVDQVQNEVVDKLRGSIKEAYFSKYGETYRREAEIAADLVKPMETGMTWESCLTNLQNMNLGR